ncbi:MULTISPECIES: chromosome partitioning protein [Amycolatopsis]|nr:chromosome partitioning protein [Amycolatopsis bullii]
MTGVEVAVAALIGWFLRKAGRAVKRVDGIADDAVDVTMDRVHDAVLAKLGSDPAVAKMAQEAESGEISSRTRDRVRMAIEEAADEDSAFAAQLATLTPAPSQVGPGGVTIKGSVEAKDHGISIGGITGGTVQFPQGPART